MAENRSRSSIFLIAAAGLLLAGAIAITIAAYDLRNSEDGATIALPTTSQMATVASYEVPSSIVSGESDFDWTSSLPGEDVYEASCRPEQRLRLHQLTILNLGNCKNPLHLHYRGLRIDFVAKPIVGTDQFADAVLTIRSRGQRPEIIRAQSYQPFGLNLTLGTLDRTGARYVAVRSFSGGIICCSTDYVAVPEGRDRGSVAFPAVVSEALSWTASFPTDVDGDGRADFVFRDERFLHEFNSRGGAVYAPLRIWNIRGGRLVEVSADNRYRRAFRTDLAGRRFYCLHSRRDPIPLACPAYAATAARLGRFQVAWSDILRVYRPGRRGSDAQVNTPDQIRSFLRANGYLPA